jgi:hypothetical protein
MPVNEVLREAVLTQQPCIISKPGEPSRKVCPYRLGKSSEGDQNILYYQYEGYTSRSGGLQPDGSSANWRCNHVDDIETAVIIEEPWHQPTQKPKTRGACVISEYVEIQGYYD